MSYTHFIEELIGFQDFTLLNIEKHEEKIEIYIEMKRKEHICPHCGAKTKKIHDYRWQTIKDLDCFDKKVYIHIHKRRYRCKCGKRITEKIEFLPRYYRMTKRMICKILDELRDVCSFTSVARRHDVSVSTVIRIFNLISYPAPKLPVAISIDEFKGNAGGQKYQCIIADPLKKQVLDILPRRSDWYIQKYFLQYPKEERNRVQIFVSDMWKPYQESAKLLFMNSMRVIDKYHWIRQIIWAFERVRKDTQKTMSSEKRKYFKRSRNLLLKPFDSLSDDDKQAVNIMLYYSSNLSSAHFQKEEFQKIARSKKISESVRLMNEWIVDAKDCEINPMVKCANTIDNWKPEILNSFTTTCTNGFIEGCNNKIKVLKRNAYGYRNQERFRNRILHIFSHQRAA